MTRNATKAAANNLLRLAGIDSVRGRALLCRGTASRSLELSGFYRRLNLIRPYSSITTSSLTPGGPILPRRSLQPSGVSFFCSRDYSSTLFLRNDDPKLSSPFSPDATKNPPTRKRGKSFVPRKAAVELTDNARSLFRKLLNANPHKDGILLNYNQSSSGQPRMVFSFSFVTKDELHERDEGVSLEIQTDGSPKPPSEALTDGLPKLYVHHNAFLKVLGATVDVDTDTLTPKLYDKEGHELDANA